MDRGGGDTARVLLSTSAKARGRLCLLWQPEVTLCKPVLELLTFSLCVFVVVCLCPADTGIVDPEQLLQARKQGVGAGNGSSSNGGSTRSRSNGASVPGSGSAPVPSTATGGSYDGADDATPKWVAASNASRQQQDGQEEDRTESGDEELTSKESEFALLQLDLSFAWRLTDEPLKDVEGVLEGAVTAGSRSG